MIRFWNSNNNISCKATLEFKMSVRLSLRNGRRGETRLFWLLFKIEGWICRFSLPNIHSLYQFISYSKKTSLYLETYFLRKFHFLKFTDVRIYLNYIVAKLLFFCYTCKNILFNLEWFRPFDLIWFLYIECFFT